MRSYEGKGTLNFPSVNDIKGSFQLTLQDDGKVNLIFYPDEILPNKVLNFKVDLGSFSGKSVNSEYSVQIDKIHLKKIHLGGVGDMYLEFPIFHPVKITYQIPKKDDRIELIHGFSNLLFWGMESTRRGITFSMDTVRVKLDDKEARLIQLEGFTQIKEHLEEYRDVRVTSEFKIEGNYKEIDNLRDLSRNTQVLCSLACGNYVTAIYEDIFNKNDGFLFKTTLFPLKTYPFSTRVRLIDTSPHGAKEFKDYLESTHSIYKNFKAPLRLPYVIELFTTSKIYSPMELQYLLTTTTLECLEYHFRNWQSLPKLEELNKKTERLLKHFNVPHKKIEAKINLIRNSIVHEGQFPSKVDGFKALMNLRNLLNRLLLVILGYRGKPYHNVVLRKKDVI